jgi:hypothetical protein
VTVRIQTEKGSGVWFSLFLLMNTGFKLEREEIKEITGQMVDKKKQGRCLEHHPGLGGTCENI